MTIFGMVITYAVCWWLVLFMVLPWGVRMEENPQPGHAVSAPTQPRLRRKLLITSLLALLPTLAFHLVVGQVKAAEPYRDPDIYRTQGAGSGCKPATAPNDSAELPVDITVPIAPYLANTPGNAGAQGGVGLGKGAAQPDGSLMLGGKRLGTNQATGACVQ